MTKPDSQQLFEIAEAQQGYFTSGQAVEAGYARPEWRLLKPALGRFWRGDFDELGRSFFGDLR